MDFESYEVQGTPYEQELDRVSMINQIVEDMIPKSACYGFKVKFHGENKATVTYHCFEVDLPYRMKDVEKQSNTYLNDFEKNLRKTFKERVGKTLKLKELKDERCDNTEKVSLNNRYYYRSSRTYEI